MDVKDFVMKLMHRGTSFTKYCNENGVPWSFREKLAAYTKYIDFNCQFDENGRCAEFRHRSVPECCCAGCAGCVGYFDNLPNGDWEVRYLAKRFDPKKGFWRDGKGCVLPRHRRSDTCLTYACKARYNSAIHLLKCLIKGETITVLTDEDTKYIARPLANPKLQKKVFDYLKKLNRDQKRAKREAAKLKKGAK